MPATAATKTNHSMPAAWATAVAAMAAAAQMIIPLRLSTPAQPYRNPPDESRTRQQAGRTSMDAAPPGSGPDSNPDYHSLRLVRGWSGWLCGPGAPEHLHEGSSGRSGVRGLGQCPHHRHAAGACSQDAGE